MELVPIYENREINYVEKELIIFEKALKYLAKTTDLFNELFIELNNKGVPYDIGIILNRAMSYSLINNNERGL